MKKCFAICMLAGVMVLAISLFSGCDDDESHPSCDEAMDNIYDEGCVITSNGYQVSESDAVEGCEDWQEDADDEGCTGDFNNLLDCLGSDKYNDCDDCGDEWDDFYDCMD